MKKTWPTVSLVILTASVFSCQNNAQVAELNKIRAQASIENNNRQIILKMYSQLTKGEMTAFAKFCTEDARIYGIAGGLLNRRSESDSPMQAGFYFFDYGEGPPNKSFSRTINEVIAKGNAVVVRLVNCGVDGEDYLFSYRGVHIWHLEDGKIFEGWILEDSLEWLIQMRRAKGLDKHFPWFWEKAPF
jgi:ketosteroid isomerase-like protein